MPIPPIIPPNIVDKSILSVNCTTGNIYRKRDKEITQTIVFIVICLPNLKYPRMSSGIFSRRFIKPIENGVINPMSIATPLKPLLRSPYGMRKKLKLKAMMKDPMTTMMYFMVCHASL